MSSVLEMLRQRQQEANQKATGNRIVPRKEVEQAYLTYKKQYSAASLVQDLKPMHSFAAFSMMYSNLVGEKMPDPIGTIINDQQVISNAQRAGIERMVSASYDASFWEKIDSQIEFWSPKGNYTVAASLTRDDLRNAKNIVMNYINARDEFNRLISTEKGFAAFNIIMNMGYDGQLSAIYSPTSDDTLTLLTTIV